MSIQLTKKADALIGIIYKRYLERTKNGESESTSRDFESDFYNKTSDLYIWSEDDYDVRFVELANNELIKVYIGGEFRITDKGLIYMENHFKNGIKDVIDLISKLIP
ncbi:MAG: hypothetical protein HFF01_00710 [Erysipelotrichaceae bacterium]|nr:hypothetical protein [Erysipelotrichaceae bacterium]